MGMSRGFDADVARNLTKEDQAVFDKVIHNVRQAFKKMTNTSSLVPEVFQSCKARSHRWHMIVPCSGGPTPSIPGTMPQMWNTISTRCRPYSPDTWGTTWHIIMWGEAIDDGFYLNDTLLDEDTVDEQSGVRDPRTVRGREWEYQTGYHQTRADDIPKHLIVMMDREAAERYPAYTKQFAWYTSMTVRPVDERSPRCL